MSDLDKVRKNVEDVKFYLDEMKDYKEEATEAARLLDTMFGLHADPGEAFDANDYLTGDAVTDASFLQTMNMHKACSSSIEFTRIVEVLFLAAAKVGGILAVFI